MTTPTWNNAPLFSDLRIEERAYKAKKAHNNSMFPTYAGHSGIEKSRQDRKTLTQRKLPLFLKRKADWEKKRNQKRLEMYLREKINVTVHGMMVEEGATIFSPKKDYVATVAAGGEERELTIREVQFPKRVGLETFHVEMDLPILLKWARRDLQIVGEMPQICLPSLLVVFFGMESAIDVPPSEDEWKMHLPN